MYTENVPCVVGVLRDTNKYTCTYGDKELLGSSSNEKGSAVFSGVACPWAITEGRLHIYMCKCIHVMG